MELKQSFRHTPILSTSLGYEISFTRFGRSKPREKALGAKRIKEWEGLSAGLDALLLSVIKL
jgi:hypothetical protein